MIKIYRAHLLIGILYFFLYNSAYAQDLDDPKENESTDNIEIGIKPQFTAIMVPFENYPSDRNPDYEIGNNSRIYGLEISASLNYKSIIGFGAGIGSEKILLENETIEYFPVFIELTPFPVKNPKKGFASFSGRIGTHLGNLDKKGFYLRADLGYYIPLVEHITLYFKGLYTHQTLFKTFSNSRRPTNRYTFDGVGFGFGLEFYL
ncbi:hypothetical protein [Salegentibacter sp. Hel_I_6]|uniref:hypothetical protein n=1 Tax=Salegentibacter sp. Hel_I_6 TaxID=1250278 RepID=UPI00055A971E|nr:hypothetical protein [Salegentibacter sp. Hel_I_6]